MLNKLLRLALSVGLLARLAWRTDWDVVRAGFAELRWQYWAAGAGLLVLAQVASAWRWKQYTDQLGMRRSLRHLTGFYFIGMYFNLMLPTSVGGDVVRAWYLDSRPGQRLSAFVSVLSDRLNGLVVLVALACLGVTLSPLALPSWISWSVWSTAACGMLGLAGMLLFARVGRLGSGRMEQLRRSLCLFCQPRILASTLFLSLFVQAANVVIVLLVGQAIHAPVPAAYYWVVVPMVSLLTLLPISVNGMGVREEAMVLFLAPVGVAEGTALTLSVLWFAVHASVSLVGGAVYLMGHFPKLAVPAEPPAAAPTGEVIHGSFGGDSNQGRAGQHRQAA